MKQIIKNTLSHPLIHASSIVVVGGLFINFFNFLFNVFMSRNLSVSDYGILASVMPLINIPILFANTVSPVIIRFAGDYFVKKDFSLLRGLYLMFKKYLIIIACVIFIIFLVFNKQISDFFHISNQQIFIITDLIIFISFINVINAAFLQAKLAFGFQLIIGLVNVLLKLGIGVFLVLEGFSVTGAVLAVLFAAIGSYLLSFVQLPFIFNKSIAAPKINSKEVFSYGIPSAIAYFCLTLLISSDILLVKHFFSPYEAGLYAGLSLMGKIIFYISAPIGSVMFPIIVQKHAKKEKFANTFKLSMSLVVLPCVVLNIFYFLFPKFFVAFFLKNKDYLTVSNLLILFGIFASLYSVLTVLINFYLSIKKTNIYIPIFAGAVLQIVLIFLFHQNFLQVVLISSSIIFFLVVVLLLYYPKAMKLEQI